MCVCVCVNYESLAYFAIHYTLADCGFSLLCEPNVADIKKFTARVHFTKVRHELPKIKFEYKAPSRKNINRRPQSNLCAVFIRLNLNNLNLCVTYFPRISTLFGNMTFTK